MTRAELLAVAKPISFNSEMVRAILEERKSVTRRKIDTNAVEIGDILWVRETWAEKPAEIGGGYIYKADIKQPNIYKWRPSIHMPKEAARLFLRVKSVRVERLQEITPEQVDAEGFKEYGYSVTTGELMPSTPIFFSIGWDSTIKPAKLPLYGWDANPWVRVIEFERVTADD